MTINQALRKQKEAQTLISWDTRIDLGQLFIPKRANTTFT